MDAQPRQWQWKQANGELRDMVCRGLLLMLERAGAIQLPAARRGSPNRREGPKRPEPLVPDNRPVRGPLGELGVLEFQQVRRTPQEPLFNSLLEQYHYLRYQQPVGEHLKYLVSAKGQVIACLAHGRRQIVEVAENFPQECRHILESLGKVYQNDSLAREQELSPEARLRFHQEHSGPVMKELPEWMKAQFTEHRTEPNSGLGKAISYFLNHWTKLTLFLSQPGSPIDNNIVERALKKAILNRRNAFFYKTLNGAHTGDLFMSLIHTCELNGANPFDYLTELQRHAAELSAHPQEWLPWNYRDTLARLTTAAAA